jgi:2-amino-4-hydroxy-6-hydroxymethyldihydropteridine diphosphokinase
VTAAYVGLGANVGSRAETILRAVDLLREAQGVEVLAVSEFIETEPVGVVEQPRFLNGAVAVETTRTPRELLELLLEIELSLGRVREERWGPRTIDLDLLVYGEEVVDEPGLRVPHPRLHERRFALEPLADLDPELDIPGRGTVAAVISALD